MKFADVIKEELYGSGTSYEDVASLLGIERNTVRGWCCGRIVPTMEHCRDLDEVFDKPCGYFEYVKWLTGDLYEREKSRDKKWTFFATV